jgi:MFS family permease
LQLLPFTLMLATGPLVASHVIDRFGLRVPMFVAMLAAGAAMFGLSTMTGDTSVAWISLWLALLGAGLSLVLVGATDAIVGNAPVRLAGVAGGLQQSAMQLGGSLGTAVLGTLVSGYVGGNLADRLVAAGAARPSAAQIAQWQGEVAQGRPAPVPGLASNLVTAVTRASHDVFLGGVSRAFLISGVVLTIASFPTLFMRRGAVAETTRKGES